jgi:glutaconate CoA-transferase subunit A
MEHFGMCRRFRAAVEDGSIEVEELSETAMLARLGAAARGLPFLPTNGMIGTDLLTVRNPALKVIPDPFGGRPVVACAALRPDVALVHAHRADRFGNVAMDPGPRYPMSTLLPRAARRVIVTVERIVDTDELRAAPERTILPGFAVDAVVEAPHGAHPTSLFPVYDYDAAFIQSWVEAAGDAQSARQFVDEHVLRHESHEAYLSQLGATRLEALALGSGR